MNIKYLFKNSKELFIEALYVELGLLKMWTTPEEKKRLFGTLVPWHGKMCIYGKLTGDTINARGMDLKDTAARFLYDTHYSNKNLISKHAIVPVIKQVENTSDTIRYLTPLEMFITFAPKRGIRAVIDYLRGDQPMNVFIPDFNVFMPGKLVTQCHEHSYEIYINE